MPHKKTENKKKDKRGIDEELKRIVIARLEVFPSNRKIFIGSGRPLTKKEMIENVEKETDVGAKIIEVQLSYLQSLKEGIFYEQNLINNKAKA